MSEQEFYTSLRCWQLPMDERRIMPTISWNKNNNKWFAGNLLKAIRKFNMITPGETVAVGMSGGIDSTVLLYALDYINRYSPLHFQLLALHVETFSTEASEHITAFAQSLGIPVKILSVTRQGDLPEKGICYTCSRLKKGALINFAEQNQIKTIAYGHHADDFAETFFMNLFEHKKIEGLSPVSQLAKGNIAFIRPMIYLEKKTIERMFTHFKLPDLAVHCKYEEENIRSHYRDLLQQFGKTARLQKPAKRIVEACYPKKTHHGI